MALLEGKAERILDCMIARCKALLVRGASIPPAPASPVWEVHYTPAAIVKVDSAAAWDQYFDTTLEHVILFRLGDEALSEMTSGAYTMQLEVWALVARKHQAGDENVYRPSLPRRITIQNRIAEDTKLAILSDIQQCNLADNTEILDINRAFPRAGWAVVEFRMLVTYDGHRPL